MKKKICIISFIGILLCLGLGVAGHFYMNRSGITEAERTRLTTEEYQAVFASMYDISSFTEEDFESYRGLKTICVQGELRAFADFKTLEELVFTDNKMPQVVYLGIDPAECWEKAGGKEEKWLANMQDNLGNMIAQNSAVSFEIMLPFPTQEYWLELTEEEMTEYLKAYQKTVDYLTGYDNVILFFYGAQDWLICNQGNYISEFCLNKDMAHFFLLVAFCDHNYAVNSDSMKVELENLQNYILEERKAPKTYPDLSQWEIVFFGDSIIALEDSSSAVPEVVAGFSNISVYDCAKGGATAAFTEGDEDYFTAVVESFLTGQTEKYDAEENMVKGIEEFYNKSTEEKNLCFVINFGLNDYFEGVMPDNEENPWDISTYGGSLRTGISMLKDVYPHAMVIVTTPNFIAYYDYGTEPTGAEGYVLSQYAEAARQVALEMDVLCMDNYTELGINPENWKEFLLADGVHLNGRGRLFYARTLISFMKDNILVALKQ